MTTNPRQSLSLDGPSPSRAGSHLGRPVLYSKPRMHYCLHPTRFSNICVADGDPNLGSPHQPPASKLACRSRRDAQDRYPPLGSFRILRFRSRPISSANHNTAGVSSINLRTGETSERTATENQTPSEGGNSWGATSLAEYYLLLAICQSSKLRRTWQVVPHRTRQFPATPSSRRNRNFIRLANSTTLGKCCAIFFWTLIGP